MISYRTVQEQQEEAKKIKYNLKNQHPAGVFYSLFGNKFMAEYTFSILIIVHTFVQYNKKKTKR